MSSLPSLRNSLIAVGLVLAGFIGGYLYSNHRAAASAAIALADWNARVEIVNKINEKLSAETQEILSANAALEAQNRALEAAREAIASRLTEASADLAYLRAHEPVQPELETQPLVINLRLQIKKGNDLYSLAIADREKADAQIANQKVEIKGLEQAYSNAMKMYYNSSALVDTATVKIARLSRQNRLAKDVAMGEAVVIVVLLVLNAIK